MEDIDISFTNGVVVILFAAIAMVAIMFATGAITVPPAELMNTARFGIAP